MKGLLGETIQEIVWVPIYEASHRGVVPEAERGVEDDGGAGGKLLFNEAKSSVLETGTDGHTSVNAMMAEMVPNGGGLTSQIQRRRCSPWSLGWVQKASGDRLGSSGVL